MEALAALGLAANIAQFVATAGTAVKKTYELALSKKSLQEENEELDIIARDFGLALPAIRNAADAASPGSNDASLVLLGERAQGVSREIEALLGAIKAQRSKRKRSAKLFATLKEMNAFDELKSLNERMSGFRDQIGLRINLMLLNQQAHIQNSFNRRAQDDQAYKSEISLKLDNIIKLVKSNIVGTGNHHDPENELSWRGTSEDLATLHQTLRSWRPRLLDFYKTEKIVTSLEFAQIEERRNVIADAHRQTYQWIFDGETANLKKWLVVEHAPIYWIAGNAGSGKSTLMKFIYNHPAMLNGIRSWAGGRTLHVASHFFWAAGTPMQQSEEGLLRSLLFQILFEHPGITPNVFPSKWETANNLLDRSRSLVWPTKELLNAFLALPSALGNDCLFIYIDGLDEYDGEHDDLIRMIKSIGSAPNAKLCVSSRPWLDFSDAFSASPWKLYLQDLTKSDIGIFIRDNLEAHHHFRRLSVRNREAAEDLVTQITTRAQGVFLWVYLVVRSLIRGLINFDSIRDLRRRVDEVPEKLEDFFARILSSIDPFYSARTAKVFLVLAHARSSLPLISFYFLDQGEEGLPFEPKTFLENWPIVNEEELDLITTKKRQLIAQCKDLIDIIELPEEPVMFNCNVLFLHRTVVDFINQPRVLSQLLEQAGSEFSSVVAHYEANLGQFSSMFHLMNRTFLQPYLWNWLLGLVYFAREMEVTDEVSQIRQLRVVDDLRAVDNMLMEYLQVKHEVYSFSKVLAILREEPSGCKFKSLQDFATQCGLTSYHDTEIREAQVVDVQIPTVYIQKAAGFRIGAVTDEMIKSRADCRGANPIYDSTFEMLTIAEIEAVQRSRLLTENRSLAIMTPVRLPSPDPEGTVSGRKAPRNKSWRSIIRKLLK